MSNLSTFYQLSLAAYPHTTIVLDNQLVQSGDRMATGDKIRRLLGTVTGAVQEVPEYPSIRAK